MTGLIRSNLSSYKFCLPILQNLLFFHIQKKTPHVRHILQVVAQVLPLFQDKPSMQGAQSPQMAVIGCVSRILDALKEGALQTCPLTGCEASLTAIIQYFSWLLDQPFCSPLLYNQIHATFPCLFFLSHICQVPAASDNMTGTSQSYAILELDCTFPLLYYAGKDILSIYSDVLSLCIEYNHSHSLYPLFIGSGSFLLLLLQCSVHALPLQALLDQYATLLHTVSDTLQSPFQSIVLPVDRPLVSLAPILMEFHSNEYVDDHLSHVFTYWRDSLQQQHNRPAELLFYQQVIILILHSSSFFFEGTRMRTLLEILFPFMLSPPGGVYDEPAALAFFPLIDRQMPFFEYTHREVVCNARKSYFYNSMQGTAIPTILPILHSVSFRMLLARFSCRYKNGSTPSIGGRILIESIQCDYITCRLSGLY